MSDRWGQLRDRFKTKDIDLDAEFEKFLNESMSDESSMGSPRLRTPDLKSKSKKDQMPWWAEEDGAEEEKKREAARQSWMKPKISDTEIKQQQPDDVDTVTMPTAATPQVPAAKDSAVTPLTGSYANTSGLSISKDNLEEGLAKSSEKTRLPPEELLKRLGSEDFEDTLTYSDEPRTGATASPSSPIPKAAAAAGPVSVGLDTMNEVADKERFFDDVEVGMSSVDYRKKLNEITSSESLTQDRKDDERFQATGAELGESIFNMTDATEPNRGVAEVEEEREDEYSDHFEDAHSPEDIDSREIEELPRSSPPERPDVVKPSMLSKVSLMESLDSTLDTKRPAAALGLPTKLNKPQVVVSRDKERQRQNDENFESKEEMSPTLRTGPDYAASGSTRDIQELQAALRAAQLTATGTGSKYSAAESFDEPEPAHIVLEKNAQGQTRAHGFDLQPVVVTNDWSTTRDEFNTQTSQRGELSSLVTVDEARGFGLNPVRVGNQFTGSVQESAEGLASGTAEPRGLDPKSAVPAPTKGRGFDLQLAVDARGFGLQSVAEPSGFDLKPATLHGASIYPSEGGRGFDLQATEERHGFNLQPVANLLEAAEEEAEEDDDDDTPPPESLQSIKNIARTRKSAGRESVKKSTEKTPATKKTTKIAKEGSGKKGTSKEKAPQKKGKGKVASSTDRSRLYQPSPSSAPSWSPTPTMRSSRPNSKKSFGASKKLNLEIPASSKMADTSPSTEHLAASVESFANYLKHFVRPENDENETPPARWSNDEPSKSTSRTSFRRPSEDGRLSRERALQAELENWQLAWKDEKKRNDKLIADVASREKEWSRREEKCRLQYESQIHELKQELFVMQTKLNETEKEADVRRRLAAGGNLEDVSEEELKKLEKEVREQEQLLTGYQQENERLYKELKQMQAKEKASEARMFSENQKLASELANLKEKIERRESAGPGTDLPVPGSAALGADKISVLTREMKTLRRRVTEVQDEAEELRRAKHEMETRLRGVENERDTVVKQNSQAFGSNASELAEIEGRHAAEVQRLRNKLKWYAETQSLLDRDVLTLRKKEEEISELRETVARLQAQHGQSVVEKKQRGAERASDAKRIQDLERQVREMEEIIRRRYPNSLPALIYAAASAPGQAQPVTTESPTKQSPTYAFLENRVRKLETELENKDEEASKRIRSIEQRYNAIRLEYDDRIRDLEKELQIANERCEDFSKTNTHKSVFEEELQAVREANNQEVKKLQTEIQVLQDALSKATALESASAKVRSKKRLELETRDSEDQSSAVQALRDKLENKELELEGLRQTCNRLQREREQMLVSDTKRVDRQTSPQPDPPITEELIRENKQLKEHLSQTSLDMDQQRIRFQGSLAEAERSARLAREEAADQLSSLQAQCKREVDQLKAEFAVNHGASKVTELKSQLAGQEIVIQRLKAKLAGASVNVETMAASKVREESLQQQVVGLQADLKRAKDMFSPQMNHFDALETKIVSLEQRHFQRELDLKRIIEKTQLTASIEKEESEARWRQVLRQKNREIEKFRCELDAILEVLSELKRQGVVIPIRNGEKFVP